MTGQADITHRNHSRAVRFFWGLLIGATAISLLGNVAHAVLPYISRLVIQVGAATVPPVALLAAVHGIALAVRAGASGRVYCWAVSAVAAIGLGAFAVSFLALRDLMRVIGYGPATAWIFPAVIDTAVAVSTLMLVALGDKPARSGRAVAPSPGTQIQAARRVGRPVARSAKTHVTPAPPASGRAQTSGSVAHSPLHGVEDATQTEATHADADLAAELIASRVTTQPLATVIDVLAASRNGASINAAARASRINFRTAQRIVEAAALCRERQLAAVS